MLGRCSKSAWYVMGLVLWLAMRAYRGYQLEVLVHTFVHSVNLGWRILVFNSFFGLRLGD